MKRNKNKKLIVVDMQNDFVRGSLGTPEAEHIIPDVAEKIAYYREKRYSVYATQDTHGADYEDTLEGKNLPVPHCKFGTYGWEIIDELKDFDYDYICPKPTFGSLDLMHRLDMDHQSETIDCIELIGVCTDICVVSNALMIKAFFPEVKVRVDASCCAGVTPEKHKAALETMRSCQIEVIE